MKAIARKIPVHETMELSGGVKATFGTEKLFAIAYSDVEIPSNAEWDWVAGNIVSDKTPVTSDWQTLQHNGENFFRKKEGEWFKILGEISSDAIWVQEKDEIEISIYEAPAGSGRCGGSIAQRFGECNICGKKRKESGLCLRATELKNVCKVKCTTCKTYH